MEAKKDKATVTSKNSIIENAIALGFKFSVSFYEPIQNSTQKEAIPDLYFHKVSGIGFTMQRKELKEGGHDEPYVLPGEKSYKPLVLEKGLPQTAFSHGKSSNTKNHNEKGGSSPSLIDFLQKWDTLREDAIKKDKEKNLNAIVTILNGGNFFGSPVTPAYCWTVQNIKISAFDISNLDAGENSIVLERVELIYDSIQPSFLD